MIEKISQLAVASHINYHGSKAGIQMPSLPFGILGSE